MESKEMDKKIVSQMAEAIYSNLSCVVYANNNTQSYTLIKGDEFWENSLGKEGKLSKLFYQLFTKRNNDATTENTRYKDFADVEFFKKESYCGNIEVSSKEKRMRYGVYLMKLSEDAAALFLNLEDGVCEANQMELDKIDAIQENYLFSMIVNLAEDSCINPNTTEVSATRQDYLDFKYSDWRLIIMNMFMETDREMFLRMSSPEYIVNTLEEEHSFDLELPMMNMEGQYIWCKLSFTRMKDFSRSNPRFVYTVRDYQKEMNRFLNQESIVKAVEQQNKELQELEQQQTKFFSNMSHEIRTPLNAIMGMNEVILREAKEESIRHYAKDVKNSGRFLLSLVNDILDYSKIRAGKMQIVPGEYNLADMIKEINTLVKSYIGEKPLEYQVRVSDELPKRLYGDEVRITQVIVNLLTNAIKYTPEGEVLFEVMPGKTEEGRFALAVKVQDTGIGIKKEELELLFTEYERLDVEKNRKIEGTGLGMGIVTSLLTQMESRLQVESVYGAGSTFSFLLPQKVVEVAQREEQVDTCFDVSDKRVLVVDDNIINLNVAVNILRPYNMKVDKEDSGQKCLEAMEHTEYDLILLDHLMPGMDGVETLHKIRERAQIPVIAMTANANPNARSEYVGMGFTDYIEKPMVPEQINMILRTYLAKL